MLRESGGWTTTHDRIHSGAVRASEYLNAFRNAIDSVKGIVETHAKWLEVHNCKTRLVAIEREHGSLVFTFRSATDPNTHFQFRLDDRKWRVARNNCSSSVGSILLDTGVSSEYFRGIEDATDAKEGTLADEAANWIEHVVSLIREEFPTDGEPPAWTS